MGKGGKDVEHGAPHIGGDGRGGAGLAERGPPTMDGLTSHLRGQVHLHQECGVARVVLQALQQWVAFKLRETAVA